MPTPKTDMTINKVAQPVTTNYKRASTFGTVAKSVNNATATLIAAQNPKRLYIEVQNNSSSAQVYVGDKNVTVSTGRRIGAGSTWENNRTTGPIYAIASAGTFNVIVTEISSGA